MTPIESGFDIATDPPGQPAMTATITRTYYLESGALRKGSRVKVIALGMQCATIRRLLPDGSENKDLGDVTDIPLFELVIDSQTVSMGVQGMAWHMRQDKCALRFDRPVIHPAPNTCPTPAADSQA